MPIYIDVDTAVELLVNFVPLTDSTDFVTRETAVAYNAAGMDLVWNFITTAGVITQTAVTPTTAGNYDWAHVGDGIYKIEMPASGGASANNNAEGSGYFSGVATGVLPWVSPLYCFRAAGLNNKLIDDAYSTERGLAGTALPAAAAEAAGGLYTRGTGAGQINQPANGQIDVNVEKWNATNVPGEHTAGYPVVTIKDGTGAGELDTASGVVLAKDHAGANLATAAALNTVDDFLDTEVAAILLGVSALLDRLGVWTGTGSNTVLGALRALFRKDADAAVPTDINADLGGGEGTADNTTDSVQAIRDRGDAAWITATGFSTLDAAGVRSAVGLASANLDTQLGDIPTVAEFEARTIVAANYGTAANQATIAGYIDTEVGAIKAVTDALGATAATRLGLMFAASRLITVDDATFTPTTTAFETDQTTDESAVYSEQVLFALDGGNVGMTVRITAYAFTNSKVKLTVDALKVAPSDGHRFLMMGRIEQG